MTGIPLRDVITIPEHVSAGDYVLKLTDGVQDAAHASATLADYIVTPELATNFDEALALIKAALAKQRSDGAFLHGSFGSGKSHFMAVLHQVLGHDPTARSLEGLATVVAGHDNWLRDRTILRLTYHLIGATNLESAILGGYVDQVRRLHPETSLPEVHVTDGLLDDADRMRATLGTAGSSLASATRATRAGGRTRAAGTPPRTTGPAPRRSATTPGPGWSTT